MMTNSQSGCYNLQIVAELVTFLRDCYQSTQWFDVKYDVMNDNITLTIFKNYVSDRVFEFISKRFKWSVSAKYNVALGPYLEVNIEWKQ